MKGVWGEGGDGKESVRRGERRERDRGGRREREEDGEKGRKRTVT